MYFQETPARTQDIKKMTRKELWHYLESRGFACYSNESTKEPRDAALEDSDPNYFKPKESHV